jgi:hypothetical protein
MKNLGELLVALLLVFISSAIVAWGYQVFWNCVVLNVWQLFASGDVINTMKIPYGACLAIAFGIAMIHNKKAEPTESIQDAIHKLMIRMFTKLIMIATTILVVTIVF